MTTAHRIQIVPAQPDYGLLARCADAVGLADDDAVVCSLTAARIHQLWLPTVPDDLHLATATSQIAGRAMVRSRRPEITAHRRQLTDVDRATVAGVPVTTVSRTWADLAQLLPLPDLVAAGDSALRSGVAIVELTEVIRRSTRMRGVRRARLALSLLDGRSRSRPESHLRVAASAPDLPRFEVNVPVNRAEGGWLAEPDLSLAAARIALEYQGADHAKVGRMRRDITRGVDLRRDGWLTLPYGPAEVFGRPWQIAPELRHEIRARAPHLLIPRVRRRVVA